MPLQDENPHGAPAREVRKSVKDPSQYFADALQRRRDRATQRQKERRDELVSAFRELGSQKRTRNAELEALRQQGANAQGLQPHERGLSDYLVRRTVDRRTIEGPELSTLRSANQTVNRTREVLSEGRGNVTDDIARTAHGSSRRTQTARDLMNKVAPNNGSLSKLGWAEISAASAEQLRAGNCQEHADVATLLHGAKLQGGQTVHQVSKVGVDHAWSELRVNGPGASQRDVVIDAWGKGPAVLREDAAFARRPSQVLSKYHLDPITGAQAAQRTAALSGQLSSNPQAQGFIQQSLARYDQKNFRFGKKWVFLPTPVLSESFTTRTNGRFGNLTSVGQQVVMAGAARQLGSNVAQAAGEANRAFRQRR